MMRLHLTDNDEAAIMALADLSSEAGFASFKWFAECGVPRHEVRRIVRRLARLGLMQFASGLWNDDGEPRGSGYGLTDYGRAVANLIDARPPVAPDQPQ